MPASGRSERGWPPPASPTASPPAPSDAAEPRPRRTRRPPPMPADAAAGEPDPAEAAAQPMPPDAPPTRAERADRGHRLRGADAGGRERQDRQDPDPDTDLGRDPVPALRRPLRLRPGSIGQAHPAGRQVGPGRVAPRMPTRPSSASSSCTSSARASSTSADAGATSSTSAATPRCWSTDAASAACPVSRSAPATRVRPHRFRRDDPLDALRKLQGATAARWAGHRAGALDRPAAWSRPRRATTSSRSGIDGQRIQRFQTVERGSGRSARATKTETVEFWDFGVPVDSLDWSRLPSFRTPR